MATVTPTQSQYPQWEFDLLKALNAPASVNNLTALNLWAQSEGNVINNPLATSGQGAGASTCVAQCGSSSPVYEYSSESAGVAQMAKFLQGSYYTAIVHAFQQDQGLAAIYQAINASPWCKGCQSGHYPVRLYAAVGGSGGSVSSGVGTGSGGTAGGGSGGAATAGSGLSQCVISLPGLSVFGLFSLGGNCLFTKGNLKAWSSAAAIVAGGAIGAFGVVLIAAAMFDASGAQRAVGKVATSFTPIGRVGKIATKTARSGGSAKKSSTVGLGRSAAPAKPKTTIRQDRQAREGERMFEAVQRDQGPIGPRGGNPTARRIAARERRGTVVAGAPRRQPNAREDRLRREARAKEPF